MQTEEPCVVVYTHQDISTPTKVWGREVQGYDGITLETQKEPDAINHPQFHSIVLSADETYSSRTKYWILSDA